MEWIDVRSRLPIPSFIEDECNDYYLIWTKYGFSRAMYMDGGWHESYRSKVSCHVLFWMDIEEPI